VLLGLKAETAYSSTNIVLMRMYKNSILVKFWRKIEIEIEGPYDLNCNETRIFGYIEQFIIWRTDNFVVKHPNCPVFINMDRCF
jgi:hypothetical protein